MVEYEYELRRDGAVVATGRIQLERPPSPGDMISLGRQHVQVEHVLHTRLILEER